MRRSLEEHPSLGGLRAEVEAVRIGWPKANGAEGKILTSGEYRRGGAKRIAEEWVRHGDFSVTDGYAWMFPASI